jgi:hypothetical protein
MKIFDKLVAAIKMIGPFFSPKTILFKIAAVLSLTDKKK